MRTLTSSHPPSFKFMAGSSGRLGGGGGECRQPCRHSRPGGLHLPFFLSLFILSFAPPPSFFINFLFSLVTLDYSFISSFRSLVRRFYFLSIFRSVFLSLFLFPLSLPFFISSFLLSFSLANFRSCVDDMSSKFATVKNVYLVVFA